MFENTRQPQSLFLNATVGARLLILVLSFLLWGIVSSVLTLTTLREVQVNGPIYERLVIGKDIVGDILPPPLFIVESNLLAHELYLSDDPAERLELTQLLLVRKKDYDVHKLRWDKLIQTPTLRQALLEEPQKWADLFYKKTFEQFIPAMNIGNLVVADRLLKEMNADYMRHREAIIKGVQLTIDYNDTIEKHAVITLNQRLLLWAGVTTIMCALILVLSLAIRRSILKPLGQAVKAVENIAAGDLSHSIPECRNDEIGKLLESVSIMQNNLRVLVGSVQADATHLTQSCEQITQAAGESAAASSAQSEAVAEVAISMDKISLSIDQVKQNSRTAQTTAQLSGEQSRLGGEVIHAAVAEMQAITESVKGSAATITQLEGYSREISTIVGVIRDIADQTNLLSLNAAIEAARAGEHGRGFAVVADEVRKLSERTTGSTHQISEMIDKVQKGAKQAVASMEDGVARVNEGMRTAAQAGNSIVGIQESANQVVQMVQNIAAALEEQAMASRQITGSVERIVQMAEENSDSIGRNAEAARQMQKLADTLKQSSGKFRK